MIAQLRACHARRNHGGRRGDRNGWFADLVEGLTPSESSAESADKMIQAYGRHVTRTIRRSYRAIERSIDGWTGQGGIPEIPELTLRGRRRLDPPESRLKIRARLPVLQSCGRSFHRSVTADQTSILGGSVTIARRLVSARCGRSVDRRCRFGDADAGGDAKVPVNGRRRRSA